MGDRRFLLILVPIRVEKTAIFRRNILNDTPPVPLFQETNMTHYIQLFKFSYV